MAFKDILGQGRPIEIIKAYIRNGCLEGGYLFTGPGGIGKKMAAKALAKALNCLNSEADSCDACPSCLKIENNQHPDVHMISVDEGQIKIDSIRQLQKSMSLKAYEGKYKVFIIDNAHTLTAEASNCLLKVLEEPAGKSVVILITDKPNLLFKTIISRCKTVKFLAFKRKALESLLMNEYKIDNNFAHFLAYFCEGRLGEALKLKDEDILGKRNNVIEKFVLAKRLRLDHLAYQSREEVRAYFNIIATWFRDIYMIKAGQPQEEIINIDRRQELLKSAELFSPAELDSVFNNISAAISLLEQNINTRLLLYNLKVGLWKA